jgi:hypothetical protein
MSDAIISDVDRSVQLEATPQGLMVTAACGVCGRHVRVLHPWGELQACLQGQALAGYQPDRAGWVISAPCASLCRGHVRYRLTPADLQGFV